MEIIRGKDASFIESSALSERLIGYKGVHIDIGTGDGRFIHHIAHNRADWMAIGIDACRENLIEVSRRAPENALFVIANALALPPELHGLAATVTINFPWGSLLEGLLDDDPGLMAGLLGVARTDAKLEVRLNGEALTRAGWTLEAGAKRVQHVLARNGFQMPAPATMLADDLKLCPTTWAKRLAYGRDPRAICLRGSRIQFRSVFAAQAMSVRSAAL